MIHRTTRFGIAAVCLLSFVGGGCELLRGVGVNPPRPRGTGPVGPTLGTPAAIAAAVTAAATESQAAATRGLDTLRSIATAERFQRLGFDNLGEVAGATLGEALPEFHIWLEELEDYGPSSTNPYRLFREPRTTLWPVIASGEVRSSVQTRELSGTWKPVRYGGASLVGLIAAQQAPAGPGAPEFEYVVSVPGLHLVFVGQQDHATDEVRMISTTSASLPAGTAGTTMVAVGETKTADEWFEMLAPAAKAVD